MTGVSTLGQVISQIDRLNVQQRQLSDLTTQLTTGRITQRFSGLDTNVLESQRARADFSSLDTYVDNIVDADRRINLTLNSIEEFQSQAENFANALTGFTRESSHQRGEVVFFDDPLTPEVENVAIGQTSADPDVDLETLQDLASSIFEFLTDLINAQEGDRYLLSGSNTDTPPLGDTGLLESAVAQQVNDVKNGSITPQQLLANLSDRTVDNGNPDALTDTVIGYSPALSSGTAGNVFVRVDESSEIDFTALGNDPGFRDILVAVTYIKDIGLGPIVDHVEIDETTGNPIVITEGFPGETIDEQTDNFYAVFNDLSATVNRALDDLDQQRFKLESARARIDSVRQSHEEQQNILQTSIDDIENADINRVAVQLQSLQLQLEASFRVSARVQELSLVNFI